MIKKRIKPRFYTILIIIFSLIFAGSSGVLIYKLVSMNNENNEFKEIEKIIDEAPLASTDPSAPKAGKYDALYAANSDFYGWIKIEGTNINYPVMHTPNDPEYYIHRGFTGNYSDSGTPFMDGSCTDESNSKFIYAHHMRFGTMFAQLSKFTSYDFYKNHTTFTFNTMNEDATYEIVAVFRTEIYMVETDAFKYYEYVGSLSEARFDAYIAGAKSISIYNTGVSASYGDQLLTLSTCNTHTENGRLVVLAKRIESSKPNN